jgi:hypothetical protein
MSEVDFPSGKWIGFYTYAAWSQRHPMDIILHFRDGTISGEGADDIGLFGIDGRYYPNEAECTWTKTYFGGHSVDYVGYREKKGIWGTWTIGLAKGGFHIWPIAEGASIEKLREEIEQESPLPLQSAKQPVRTDVPVAYYR